MEITSELLKSKHAFYHDIFDVLNEEVCHKNKSWFNMNMKRVQHMRVLAQEDKACLYALEYYVEHGEFIGMLFTIDENEKEKLLLKYRNILDLCDKIEVCLMKLQNFIIC